MYKPYLRGKLNEMMALRELSDLIASSNHKIAPIIEPVTKARSFQISLQILAKKNINFTIILNPKVGAFKYNSDDLYNFIGITLAGYNNYQVGIIKENSINAMSIIQGINDNHITPAGISIIHNTLDTHLDAEIRILSNFFPLIYNVINLNKTLADRTYLQTFSTDSRISLADYFKSQTKNSLYLSNPDSTFSNEFAKFIKQNNRGFADYLTVGDTYSESGASPYAVAIHISYLNGNSIGVKHFTSDTNIDQSDPAGKFFEANAKLVEWCNLNGIQTRGSNIFRELQSNQHYPGLGVLKKLSIMNHIELILGLI